MKKWQFLIVLTLMPYFAGCGPKTIFLTTRLSSPQHHVNTGMLLFEKGRLDEAQREFELALKKDSKLVKAYTGLALVNAAKGNKDKALENLRKAESFIQNEEDSIVLNLARIRVAYIAFNPEFLSMAEQAFSQIMQKRPGYPPACFYMGFVYEKAFLFDKALSLFNKVLKSENKLILKAYNEIDKISKIEKAHPISNIGKEIGLKNTITRADMAALLVHELKLPQILEIASVSSVFIKDIGGERFAEEIKLIAPYHLEELSPTVDGYFDPDLKLTKASFCVILQDVYVRISGDEALKRRFKDIRSPYKDLSLKAPYYNACVFALIKGFVLPQDRLNKEFGPLSPVSGADALLGLKRLKKELRLL